MSAQEGGLNLVTSVLLDVVLANWSSYLLGTLNKNFMWLEKGMRINLFARIGWYFND
jgi:hypothetical protein